MHHPVKCIAGERRVIYTSPLSSQCKMPTPLPILLELHSAMHSATAEAYMYLHIVVGVGLRMESKTLACCSI